MARHHKTRRARRALGLLGVLAVMAVGACGSDDDGPSSDASGTAADTASTETTASATSSAAATSESSTASSVSATTSASVAATTTTAAGETWDATVEAAKQEGKVTLYAGHTPDQLAALADAFQSEYGITLEFVRFVDVDNNARLEAEKQTGNAVADVMTIGSLSLIEPKAEAGDWYVAATGPNFDNPQYDRTSNYFDGDYFIVSSPVLAFGWNTEEHPQGLDDYSDLLDPSLAGGRIGVIDPTGPSLVDFYLYLEDTFGEDFVAQLAEQEPRIYPSALPIAQAMGSGEIAAGAFVLPQDDAKATGAPVDSGFSPSGIWGIPLYGAVLAQAPHPNAAQVLADFMISPKGQEALARGAASTLPGTPGAVATIDQVKTQDLSRLTPEAVTAYQEKFNSLFR